ncbi:hypothetical protein AJ79_07094 [Helicocarpus griseus UAMH5409]|uniref:Uncharacterized protein n=1 Tax=Helicocarpus griseus UAMH5409 TaxID=1447875 RepID=A0A2B7X6T1_9EURO|nr:hypothetical protein AJ79_07094 [Helicocarpus griseus UAMH5409]
MSSMNWLYPFSGLNKRSSSRNSSRSHNSSRNHRRHSSRNRYSTSSRHSGSRSSPSLFNLGGHANRSTASSIFSLGGSSSSSRRAKPRSGFISRMLRKIRRLFRDIVYYARRHPLKVFMMVIMPLITGGVLQKLLAVVGIRLPPSLGGHKGQSHGGLSTLMGGAGAGLGESVGGLVSLAKMFV